MPRHRYGAGCVAQNGAMPSLTLNRRLWIALSVVALLALAGWRMTRAPEAAAVTPQAAPLVRTLQFSGRVAAKSRVELGSTLTARVAAVTVREGEAVRAGQVLLRLEDDEARAALAQAEAAWRQARARAAGLRGTGRDAADATLAQAQAQLRAAEADQRRTEDLVARGFLSPARLDESRRAAEVARAQADAARAQRAGLAPAGSELAQAEAAEAAAQAAVQAARVRLDLTRLKAPADGRVIVRAAEPGQIVQPGKALLTLAVNAGTELLAEVDERFLAELRTGQDAAVLADALPGERFAARLVEIAPRVDAQRGAVQLRFNAAQAPAALREDMTLSLEVVTARRESARVLPLAALRPGAPAGEAVVWVADNGRVAERRVRLGLRTAEAAELLDGLAPGEAVLLGPAPAPGARVRPVAASADTPSTPAPGAARGGDGGTALSQGMGR